MNQKEKDKIRTKHEDWLNYRLGDFAVNEILNEDEKIKKSKNISWALLRKLGFILSNGMEIHHNWNNPNEIYDYLPKDEHIRRYHL